MITTIPTKDVGEVKDRIRPECKFVKTLENMNEDYIKRELGFQDG